MKQFGVGYKVKDGLKRFKEYKRNGKIFMRDYKRDVKGGISLNEWIALKIKRAQAAMKDNWQTNIYSSNKLDNTAGSDPADPEGI